MSWKAEILEGLSRSSEEAGNTDGGGAADWLSFFEVISQTCLAAYQFFRALG